MDFTQVQLVIDMLPEVLKYVVPGYITLWIHNSIIAKKLKESNHMVFRAIIISYLYEGIINKLVELIPTLDRQAALISITILAGICISKVFKSKWFEKVLDVLNITSSPHTDIIDRIRDENGTWLKIYLDDIQIMYEGSLRYDMMDSTEEQDIALSGYRKYKVVDREYGQELQEIEDCTSDESKWIVIKYNLVTRLEIVYNQPK